MTPPVQALPDPPDGRFFIAFDDDWKTWAPTWTRLDSNPNLVTSYTIDRGRSYELDRTDSGRATVELADPTGIMDPTNTGGPYYGKIEPGLQAMIGRRNPITGEWRTRFRGFIDEYDYTFHPSQRVNTLTIGLVDLFEVLGAIEMQPGEFGDEVPAGLNADIYFAETNVGAPGGVRYRLTALLEQNAAIPLDYVILFSGNVELWQTSYSAGETVLDVCADAADAEFPGIGNIYVDRYGRFVFHGRLAKFTPDIIYENLDQPYRWDWHSWDVGDGTAVHTDPANCAHIREFAFERGTAKVINSASSTPAWSPRSTSTQLLSLTQAELTGQLVKDTPSQNQRGIRSWTTQNLQTRLCSLDQANALVETKRFAQFYVDNWKDPRNRISLIGFRSMHPLTEGAGKTWQLLTEIDISDQVYVTVDSPGGGGFLLEQFFVEGIHEECHPLGTDAYDDATVRLDLSPGALPGTIPPAWQP
jgi:hypothetical protein